MDINKSGGWGDGERSVLGGWLLSGGWGIDGSSRIF